MSKAVSRTDKGASRRKHKTKERRDGKSVQTIGLTISDPVVRRVFWVRDSAGYFYEVGSTKYEVRSTKYEERSSEDLTRRLGRRIFFPHVTSRFAYSCTHSYTPEIRYTSPLINSDPR